MSTRIAYWNYNYMPKWEAASKEVRSLMEHFGQEHETAVYAFNFRKRRFGRCGSERHIPMPWGALLFPFVGKISSRYTINHLFASASEHYLLSRLRGKRKILTFTKETSSLSVIEKNIPLLKTLDAVVVECNRHHELLLQASIPEQKLHLVYPGVEKQPCQEPKGPFNIFFASSPPSENDLMNRGILLMLQVAKKLPDVQFVFAWRSVALQEIQRWVKEMGLTNVTLKNGEIKDMNPLYQEAHAVALPGLTHNSLKPCPHSGLESLAHGRPLLVSRPTSIADVVEKEGCGLVFDPTVAGMVEAVQKMQRDYQKFSAPCQSTVETLFSREKFLKAYSRIYESLL